MRIITKDDIISKAISIIGTIKGLHKEFVCFDCSYGAYLELEQLLCIVFYTKGSGDKLPQGVKGGSYGNGMTLWMSDGRLAIGIKKWHDVDSF